MGALTRSNLASRRSARRDRAEAKHYPEVVFEARRSASASQMGSLAQQGFRFVRRGTVFTWVHPAEVLAADLDCTAMSDAEFEGVAAEAEQQALAADRALNAAKSTPAYFDLSLPFALEQQNGRAS